MKKLLCIILVLVTFFAFTSCESIYEFNESTSFDSDVNPNAPIESNTEDGTEIKNEAESDGKLDSKETSDSTGNTESTKPTESTNPSEPNGSQNSEIILKGEPIRVMSYNLKNGYINANRKANTIKDITDFMPDTIGTQETNMRWFNTFEEKGLLDEYELVGEQRYGDKVDREANDNEASAILYRKSKFNLIDSGTYWLSETPEEVNSKLEESKYVRIMTYVVLERKTDGVRFVHVNTHLNTTPAINLRQVQIMISLVNERIYSKHGKLPTFYTGDFNADPSSENEDGYKYLISTGTENARDVAKVSSDENTITGGGKIDHCVVTKGDFYVTLFDVDQERTDTTENAYSNHYPICVEMYLVAKK